MRNAALAALVIILAAPLATGGETITPAPEKKLYVVATAHLDTQWLWTIRDTINECVPNTLRGNLALIGKYPDYVFSFEGAFRYALAKEYYPEEYAKLKDAVAKGRWRVAGSMWDAVDVNVPSPESLIRQVLHGNGFFMREFGKTSCDIYLPDCFGFGYALPSIAAHCGLKGFSTQKLTWGSANGIPFDIGAWEGVDGSVIVAALNAGDYNGGIETDLSQDKNRLAAINRLGNRFGLYAGYMYFGVGDYGGAPKDDSVAWLEKSIAGTGPARVRSAGSDQLYRDLGPKQVARLPKYQGELLLTTHGVGCYTSQSAMKRWNRKNELLADAAEHAAVAADWVGGAMYPGDRLAFAWRRFLWHQFHDDLTGTSIPEAYAYSWNDELLAGNLFAGILADSVGAVSRALDTTAQGVPLVVYNPLSITREDIVEAEVEFPGGAPESVAVFDPAGKRVPAQSTKAEGGRLRVVFLASLPPIGFGVFDVRPEPGVGAGAAAASASTLSITATVLENSRYRVVIDSNGDISSIRDKRAKRNLLSAPARIEMLRDTPDNYPAWEIRYRDVTALPYAWLGSVVSAVIEERGPARVTLALTRRHGKSVFVQRIRLAAGDAGNRVVVDTEMRWRTRATLAKASFPLSISNRKATYDLGVGTIARGNNSPKLYEVPAQQWADITSADGGYGVAILNDCRYGWDKPANNILRLSLVRSPGARGDMRFQALNDMGTHSLSYAVVGHAQGWREARIPWEAARLNQPLIAFQPPPHPGPLGRTLSMLFVSTPQAAVRCLKMSEDGGEIVIRLQELNGRPARSVEVAMPASIAEAREVNGAEEPVGKATIRKGRLIVNLNPYQPRAFALKPGSPSIKLVAPLATPADMLFDTDVISEDGKKAEGSFDDTGHSLPTELVPSSLLVDGIRFNIGPGDKVELNALTCRGQVIPLEPGNHDKLYLLAAATEDTTGTFYVARKPVVIPVQSWTGFVGQWDSRLVNGKTETDPAKFAPAFIKRDSVAWVGTHRHTADGKNDPYAFCYLYKYRIDLPAGCDSMKLPDNPRIRIFAMSYARNPNDDTRPASVLYEPPFSVPDLPEPPDTTPLQAPDNPSATAPGLKCAYYEGKWEEIPDFSKLKPAKEWIADTIDLERRPKDEFFGLLFTGWLEVPKDGVYTFFLSSDDGSRLKIGNAVAVDNDGLHGAGEVAEEVGLKAGKHALVLDYFNGPTDRALKLEYEGPGNQRQAIPPTSLTH
jgi:alpha-mannosidase